MNQWGKYGVFVCVFNWCRCHFLVHLILVSNVIIKVIQQKQKLFVRKKKQVLPVYVKYVLNNGTIFMCYYVGLCDYTAIVLWQKNWKEKQVIMMNSYFKTINLLPSKFYVQMSFYLAVLQNKFHESCSYIFCCTCSLKE